MWISNSAEAEFFVVFANLDPSRGYKGITAFIVERDMPGVSIGKREKKLGIRASSTCPVDFDDVEIPARNLLGEEGKGYRYAIELLNEGRIGIAAQMTGLALGAWENAARYVISSHIHAHGYTLNIFFSFFPWSFTRSDLGGYICFVRSSCP
jgi:alkylation response protein AidB-like acyl-CoA dehydrogenase